jgi:ParB-like chromosome segregation protein Spo0J
MITKEFITVKLGELHPYENNPRINDNAVSHVKESIKQCENLDPIEIDENGVILSGHTRLLALQELGYTETEVVRISGLDEDQKRKYRILANKTNEIADWDFDKLAEELDGLDFDGFDFGFEENEQIQPFDSSVLDELFADAPEKQKQPKMITCPHCGKQFEA